MFKLHHQGESDGGGAANSPVLTSHSPLVAPSAAETWSASSAIGIESSLLPHPLSSSYQHPHHPQLPLHSLQQQHYLGFGGATMVSSANTVAITTAATSVPSNSPIALSSSNYLHLNHQSQHNPQTGASTNSCVGLQNISVVSFHLLISPLSDIDPIAKTYSSLQP